MPKISDFLFEYESLLVTIPNILMGISSASGTPVKKELASCQIYNFLIFWYVT